MSSSRIAAVILAAGSSTRLGQSKQLLPIEGQPLLRRTVQTVLASEVDALFVTLPPDHTALLSSLAGLYWAPVVVEHPELGQSESVRAGLQAAEHLDHFDAVLFTPCDLPLLTTSHLDALIERYNSGSWEIVSSRYSDTLGAPLIIDRRLWPEIYALRGDTGARKIIASHRETTTSVSWEEGIFDIDTPEDVNALIARQT